MGKVVVDQITRDKLGGLKDSLEFRDDPDRCSAISLLHVIHRFMRHGQRGRVRSTRQAGGAAVVRNLGRPEQKA